MIEDSILGYSTIEIVIIGSILLFILLGMIMFFQLSHLYKRRRLKDLLKASRIALKRPLTIFEVLTIRTAYYHLDYSEVLEIITGVHNAVLEAE